MHDGPETTEQEDVETLETLITSVWSDGTPDAHDFEVLVRMVMKIRQLVEYKKS